jgi:hypothetical protein
VTFHYDRERKNAESIKFPVNNSVSAQKSPCRKSVNPAKIQRMENKLLPLQELEGTWWWKRPKNRPEMERIKLFGY